MEPVGYGDFRGTVTCTVRGNHVGEVEEFQGALMGDDSIRRACGQTGGLDMRPRGRRVVAEAVDAPALADELARARIVREHAAAKARPGGLGGREEACCSDAVAKRAARSGLEGIGWSSIGYI